eukprot:11779860-Karenia_brevis.AAC.1
MNCKSACTRQLIWKEIPFLKATQHVPPWRQNNCKHDKTWEVAKRLQPGHQSDSQHSKNGAARSCKACAFSTFACPSCA